MRRAFGLLPIGLILIAAFSRVIPHLPNFTPVGAIALFSGALLARRRDAFLVPLTALLFSDVFLGFHAGMVFVYGAFALTVLLGRLAQNRLGALRLATLATASSLIFFFVTNFGVWLVGGLYERSAAGLAACFVAAIPFYHHTLLGDLSYTAALFGAYLLVQKAVSPAQRSA